MTFIENVDFTEREAYIARQIIKEIRMRLLFLVDVGLDYLTLDRAAGSLSGGEAQRIRLATQVGSGLMGVLYVLDEPSVGLHPRDNNRLLATLERLRDLGNTVIVVEHDEDAMRRADHILDIGPGAGVHGGRVVGQGKLEDIMRSEESLTGQYQPRKIHTGAGGPKKRKPFLPEGQGSQTAQSEGHRCTNTTGDPDLCHRGVRFRKEYPGGGYNLPPADAVPAREPYAARSAPGDSGHGPDR